MSQRPLGAEGVRVSAQRELASKILQRQLPEEDKGACLFVVGGKAELCAPACLLVSVRHHCKFSFKYSAEPKQMSYLEKQKEANIS